MAEYYILDDEKKKRQQMLKQLEVPNVVGGVTTAKTAGTTASAVQQAAVPKVSTVQAKPQAITRESAMQDIKKQQAGDVASQLRQVQGTNRAAQKKAILDSGGVPSDEKQQTVTLGDRVGAVGDSAFAGLTGINRTLTSPLKAVTDLTAPLYQKIEDSGLYQNAGAIGKGLIGHFSGLNLYQGAKKIADYYYGADDEAQKKVQENIQQGKIGEIGNALTQGTVQAVPSAIAAFMSGGSSVGAQAAAQTGQTGAQLMGQELQRIASSPQFILSATQSFGGAYDEAMESGASPTQAITAAVMTALPESLIETMGGTEKLVQKLAGESGRTGVAGKLKDILQSMAEEGLEEIVQYPVSGTVAKGSYAPETKVFSTTEKAIINPVEMGQAGAMGAAIGGIMGGGANVVNAGIDAGSRIASRAAGDIRAGAENAQIAGEMARRRLADGIETGDIKADVRAESHFETDTQPDVPTDGGVTDPLTQVRAETAAIKATTLSDRGNHYPKPYSPEDVKLFKTNPNNLVEGVDVSAEDFFKAYYDEKNGIGTKLDGSKKAVTLFLGRVPDKTAADVNQLLSRYGVSSDVTDYNFRLKDGDVRHFYDKHGPGVQQEQGQVAITPEIASKYVETLSDPSMIGLSDQTDNGKSILYFVKKINGYTVAVEMVSDGKKSFLPKTMYAFESGSDAYENFIKTHMKRSLVRDPIAITSTNGRARTAASFENSIPQPRAESQGTVPDRVVNHILARESTVEADVQTDVQTEAKLSTTGQEYQNRAVSEFRSKIQKALGVPNRTESRETLNPMILEAAAEIHQTGKISKETADRMFEAAYQRGVVIMDEYYNQYKGLRDEIRTTPLMLSPEDKSNIQDYNSWRRQNMGIVTVSQRGTPVDIKYQELSGRYPDLFPADITHPADQLQKIAEVARGITRTEMDLDSYYGDDAAAYKAFARDGFDQALEAFADEIRYVKRYEESRAKAPDIRETVGEQQLIGAWDQVDQAQEAAKKIREKYLLTDNDRVQAERLAKGEITADQLPPGVATNAIIEVAAAERAILDAEEPIRRYNAARHDRLDTGMDQLVEESGDWIDKKTGFQYMRETMERNIRDITGNSREGQRIIDAIFTPIHQNEAGRQRMINQYKDQIRALQLTEEESAYVQMVGEGVMDLEAVPQKCDKQKIQRAITLMRDQIYPELLGKVNEVLVRNGYKPIHGRNNYFPHFESSDDPLVQAFDKLGMKIQTDELPADINGLTHTFKPGKQWSGNLQERTGNKTQYGALEGFDRYIESISSVIWHTDDIQNLRALESAIRRKYSKEGQKERIDAVRADPNLTEEDRQQRLEELFGEDLSHLGGFASELRSYTDSLAGKKSLIDRTMERFMSRKWYSISKALEGRVAANMVALNPGSWLTNFIPIAQATAQVKPKYLISAMNDTVRAKVTDDGFRNRSAFLTNRKGSDPLCQTKVEQVVNALAKPMNWIDSFTSQVVTRGLYKQNVDAGMAPSAAMADADARAAEIMADRSKGALPTIFEAKNPLAKLFTMYQVEVNNQMSWMFKDIPREAGQNGKKRLAAALMSLGISSWLYNELYEYFVGRRPAFDVIGMATDAIDAYKNEDVGTATLETLKSVGGQLPFVGGLMEGGRIPISSAIPDLFKISQGVDGLTSGEMAPNAAWGKIGKELAKPAAYLLPPVGGGQLKKSIEGLSTVLQGGSYTTKSDGSREMQYPVEQTVGNAITGLLFGKSSLPGANRYYQNFEKTTELSGRGNLLDAFNLSGKTTSRDTVAENAAAMDTPRIVEWSTTDEDGLKTPHSVTLTGKQQKQYREIYQSLLPEGFGQMEEKQQQKARQYAKQMAQAQILESIGQEGYTPDNWVLEAKEAEDAGIGIKQYIGLKEILSGIESDKDEDGKTITGSSTEKKREVLMKRSDLTNEQKSLIDQLLIQSGDSRKQVDYSSPEALQYSTLSKDEKARVDAARAAFPSMSVDDVDKYQEICGSGTAAEKREKLQEMGMSLLDSVVFEQLSGTSAAKIDTADKEAALKSTMSGTEKNQLAAAQLAFPGMPAAEYLTFKAVMGGSDDVAALKELGMSTKQAQKFIRLTKLGESDKVESWEDVLLATMTDTQQEKLQTVRQYVPEMSVEAFDRIYTVVSSAQGVRNAKGKTISGSKKQAAIAALMALGLSYEGAEIMYNVCG